MATAPTYIEGQAIPRENGLVENLMDFSFQRLVTPRMLKMLYSVHLLIGFVAAVWIVFAGFQTSTSNGLTGAHSRGSGHASVDRVLPHRRGTFGRNLPCRPGDHQFAGVVVADCKSFVIRNCQFAHSLTTQLWIRIS